MLVRAGTAVQCRAHALRADGVEIDCQYREWHAEGGCDGVDGRVVEDELGEGVDDGFAGVVVLCYGGAGGALEKGLGQGIGPI